MYLRIISHGKIADLSQGFNLPGGAPFSIMVCPKRIQAYQVGTVHCKLIGDGSASDLPIVYNDWTPALIQSLSANAIDLSDYDVYWGGSEPHDLKKQ